VHLDGGVAIRQRLDEDVIDDVTISTVPVVIGTGRRLFGGRPQTKTWTLASARSFPSGLVQAHYDRKR
jgi:dihydrofolate reductase